MTTAAALSTPYCTVTDDALTRLAEGQGRRFTAMMGIDPARYAADTLNPIKAEDMAAVLETYAPLHGKRVLEIGAGCGVSHIVWTRKFGIDGWGIEPEDKGFDASAAIARDLIRANALDPARIVDARGEALPFDDRSFDIVYSSNVLEHVDDPAQMLREAFRVLKPGGTLQIVCPNYLSYFDGHYGVLHPPIFANAQLRAWVKWLHGKDPAFAGTLRTEINPLWVRRQLAAINATIPHVVLTLGQEKFLERVRTVDVKDQMALGLVRRVLQTAQRLRLHLALARVAVALQGWTPLIITARRL